MASRSRSQCFRQSSDTKSESSRYGRSIKATPPIRPQTATSPVEASDRFVEGQGGARSHRFLLRHRDLRRLGSRIHAASIQVAGQAAQRSGDHVSACETKYGSQMHIDRSSRRQASASCDDGACRIGRRRRPEHVSVCTANRSLIIMEWRINARSTRGWEGGAADAKKCAAPSVRRSVVNHGRPSEVRWPQPVALRPFDVSGSSAETG